MLEVVGLEAGYGDGRVLFGVELAVGAGEVVTLLGRNGMGKTTTLSTIMGILRAQGGTVRFGSAPIHHLPAFGHEAKAALRDAIGRLAQQHFALKARVTAVRSKQAHQGADCGGLAHAIAPEQGHDLARVDGQIDPEQHPAVAIAGFEPGNL